MPSALENVDAIAAEFVELEPRERLELLLEFADQLPPLGERHRAERDAGLHRIHECQSPVFIWVELVDGRVAIDADVAPEAPTVKGFVSVVVSVIQGLTLADALTLPDDLAQRLGLTQTLGMQRSRGLAAVVFYLRRQLMRLAATTDHFEQA